MTGVVLHASAVLAFPFDEIGAGVRFVPLSVDDAELAAALRGPTRAAGLSVADRCCLALAKRTGRRAVTADRAWAALAGAVDVQLIR